MPIYVPGKVVLAQEFTWNDSIWNPSMIQTALWLDAADSSTVTTISDAVSQWNDKSGNSRNASQSTALARPAYTQNALNGRAVVSFDGSNDILGFTDSTLGTNVSGLSYLAVFRPNQPSTSDYRALFDLNAGGISSSSDRNTIYLRQNTTEIGGRRLDADSYQFLQFGDISSASYCLCSIVVNYSSATLGGSLNGASLSLRSGGFQAAGNTSNTNSQTISLGSTSGGVPPANNSFVALSNGAVNCDLAEFVVIQSAVSDANRQKTEGYLAHKWGLTANLPSDHPYKTVGPTP
jgi:hypothetical protein